MIEQITAQGRDAARFARRGAKRFVRRTLPHPIYRLYRQRRVARQIASYAPREVTHTYGGHRLRVWLADPLAEAWYDHDWPRLAELDELPRAGALRVGATVFDLGAHQAVVALMLSAEVGPSGRVLAVEAEPHNASIARRNVELNSAANVMVIDAAVSDRPGRLNFAESLNGRVDAGTRSGNVEVAAVTIDQLAQHHGCPDLVFLDIEGYEGKALDGAEATLRRGQTSFFVEVHGDDLVDCSAAGVIAHFAGYEVLVADPAAGREPTFAPLGSTPPVGRFFLLATPKVS